MKLKIYGHPGCTTVKKAQIWATENKFDVEYSHFKSIPDLEAHIRSWVDACGIDLVFNKAARTLKNMTDEEQSLILQNQDSMIAAMACDPRLIKRPVGTDGELVLTGFKMDDWSKFKRS